VNSPALNARQVVDDAEAYPDAKIIQNNIDTGLLATSKMHAYAEEGEEAVFRIFTQGKFDAVCSDDKRFIKRLKMFEIPYITPVVFVAILLKKGKITVKEARKKLDLLSPYVSEDEYNSVKLVLDNWRIQ
jgi:hypothetical protein